MRHLVVSIESLGRKPGHSILEIGWHTFEDWDAVKKEPSFGEIYIPVEQNLAYGMTANAETARFWIEDRQGIKHRKSETRPDATMPQLLSEVSSVWNHLYYKESVRQIWAKHAHYFAMLDIAFDLCKIERPMLLREENFRNRRYIHSLLRTLSEISWMSGIASASLMAGPMKVETSSLALYDARNQAHEMTYACNKLRKMADDANLCHTLLSEKLKAEQKKTEEKQRRKDDRAAKRKANKKR